MSRLEQLQMMWDSNQSDPDVPYMIAHEHGTMGEHQRALAWYDKCLAVDPEYHYAYFHKARSLDALGMREDAEAIVREGLERARAAGRTKASEELETYLEELVG